MAHPADEHPALHVLAEVQKPGEQLVLCDSPAREHDAVRPAHLVVQRERLHPLQSLARETGVSISGGFSRTLRALCNERL